MRVKGSHPFIVVIFVLAEIGGGAFSSSQNYWALAFIFNTLLVWLVSTKSIRYKYLYLLFRIVYWGIPFLSLINGIDHLSAAIAYCRKATYFESCYYTVGISAIQMLDIGVSKAVPILMTVSIVSVLVTLIDSDQFSILVLRRRFPLRYWMILCHTVLLVQRMTIDAEESMIMYQISGRSILKKTEKYRILRDLITSMAFRALVRYEDGMPALHCRLLSITSVPTLSPIRHIGWADFVILFTSGLLLVMSKYIQHIDQVLGLLWAKR